MRYARLGMLLAGTVLSLASAPADDFKIERIEVQYDHRAPTSLYVRGLPVDMMARVGVVYELVSWPGVYPDPETNRVEGRVEWSVPGGLGEVLAVDDTLTLLTFERGPAPGELVTLRAEMKPVIPGVEL